LNVGTALLGLFVAMTILFASTTVYESGTRTTLTSTTTSTSTAISVSTTTSTTTQTTTVTSTFDLTKPLTDAYLSHIGAIVSDNAPALAAQYETNATLLYDFYNAAPSHGSFNGSANIPRFYGRQGLPGAFITNNTGGFFPSSTFAVANDTYSITTSNDQKEWNVTSHLIFYGNDPECPAGGIFVCPSGTAFYYVMGFDISYVLQGGHWLISTENVTYLNEELCVPVSLSPDGSILTCPTLQEPS
jgi:hypothetical protein